MRSLLAQSLAAVAFLATGAVIAEVGYAPAAQAWEGAAEVSATEPDWNSTANSLRFESTSYLFPVGTHHDHVYSTLSGNLKARFAGDFWEFSVWGEGLATLPPTGPGFYFELPEFGVGTSPGALGPVRLTLGRRLEPWSHLDDQWRLGIWQPRFRWDYLQPESVGLTGLYAELNEPVFRLVAFGSFVAVPERGVSVSTQSGALVSDSPWFISPASQVSLSGDIATPTPVRYDLAVPPLRDLLLKPSVSFLGRVGRERGAWASAAYAYKPMNQLLLSFDAYLQHSMDGPYVPVTVVPRVAYHHVASVEGGYAGEHWNAWLSGLWDTPVTDPTDPSRTNQEVSPSFAVSPTIDYVFEFPRRNPLRLDVSYLYQRGGNASDSGRDADPTTTRFEARYPYSRAASLGAQSGLPEELGGWARRLTLSTHFTQDIAHSGQILSTELRYVVPEGRGGWTVSVGADVLGSDSGGDGDAGGYDLIARYQGYDRVYGGLTYAF